MELVSYYIMAYEHFYLGNVDKFKFYIERYENGFVEADDSFLKIRFENAERAQAKVLSRVSLDRDKKKNDKKEKTVVNLPSPSISAGMANKKPKFNFDNESR
jgi:hypothetical protein